MPAADSATLPRSLNLWQLGFYGVGAIVGAGIYSIIGAAAGEAGPALWVSLLAAGFAALLAALSYAELSSMHPRAGAEYRYVRSAFPQQRFLAYLIGLFIAVNCAATSATVALAFAGYLENFVALPALPVAFALLTLCTLANIAGIRQATWLSIGLIGIEISGLLLMIVAGWTSGAPVENLRASLSDFSAAGVFSAAALMFFMFFGFEDVANLSEEARRPRRDVPRALLGSVIVTTIIYLLVCISVFAVVGPEQIAASASPLTTAGEAAAPWIGSALAVAALFATASTALISLVSVSRLIFAMGRDNFMPGFLGVLHKSRRTPWTAGLALYVGACLMLFVGEIRITASVSSLGLLCVFIAIHLSVIRLRFKQPRIKRPFRLGANVGPVPVTALAGLVVSLAFLTQFPPRVYVIFGAAIALGFMLYLFGVRRVRRA